MKFINYLKSIAGVEIYPMISLFIFFIFFFLLTLYALRANKHYIQEVKNIPFDNERQ
ncbi:MAG TPA: CcoQ/FixQ family Cbb3-type cytochrome c oxidase assembly chaperone [Bacteroidia bacterium]|jgi:cbb3-type cytochrome oxidase subunit 3|nr:CcoQ/FixQ family Cbb3-type cytochrome c oxidase assembly chaperone [Bacteroidia bacterium]